MNNPMTLLVVQNLERSLSFYTEMLGLTLLEQHVDCIKLAAAEHSIFMFQGTAAAAEYSHGEQANATLVFSVADIDSKMAELKARGVSFLHAVPNENRWGRYAAFKDPSGIIHELFELKGD
ncbi:glyoxalase [Shewanella mangrovi]|uniref:Glyoxalase n=1 Tax=Shewanella mangrovi TaxID=1515746 RepID=A0A094LPE8_9GAMM|nr:VOC family protein [Shewanella mangrovi]KFZ37028.1 glyoxalase [Shewanella mangrovi]